jgi:osmoprotectant transport system permease protein
MTSLLHHLEQLGPDLWQLTYEHMYLTFTTMIVAIAVAVPLGIFLARNKYPRLSLVIMNSASIIQTVPSLALISFIVVLFAAISLPTVGAVPALVALVLYALLPILRNTCTGIKQVDPSVIEVATGLGMKQKQILFSIELPLALPVIMAGVRIATVWTIGIATLCGLIGAGGLGEFIIRGLRSMRMDYLLAGTVPAAILALFFDWTLGRLEGWLTPEGIKTRTNKA